MTFAVARNRDAWFVIRGYVYQVQQTIDRWLALGADEQLELECGEDIDTISKWCDGERNEERLLEQIKHFDGSVTLNSDAVRGVLANFVEHRVANPTTNLRLRFVTTATVARERSPAMARRMTGVRAWDAVRSGSLGRPAHCFHLAALRRLLRAGTKPESIPTVTWTTYQDFLASATATELNSFVGSVEWSMAAAGCDELRPRIKGVLQRAGWAKTEAQAEQQYAALFVYVFHSLSRRGAKRLSPSDRATVLEQSTISGQDAALLRDLDEAVRRLQGQVERLSTRVDEHDMAILGLKDQVLAVAATYGIHGTFSSTAFSAALSCPRGAHRRSARAAAVASIGALLEKHSWVALHGTSGAGKTELALLTAEQYASRDWISLRDVDPGGALFCLHGMLTTVCPKVGTNEEWYASVAAKLSRQHLLVLDDLPPHEADSALGVELAVLAGALAPREIRILSTGAQPPPLRMRHRLGTGLHVIAVPPFEDSEAAALLSAHGAPPEWLDPSRVRFLNTVTTGHAELLVTAAVYLERAEWRCSEQEIQALLSRDYASSLESDVMRRLLATVASDQARQLLFRAALAIGAVSLADLTAIAAAEPAIDAPRTAITLLEGLWIQSADDRRYTLCPLVRAFDSEIPAPTRQQVHRILGDRTVSRGVMGPLEVVTAITHYIQAVEFDRAGSLLLLALCDLAESTPNYDAGLLELWADGPLPTQMDLGLRVYIRTQQLAALEVRGKRIDVVVTDLLTLSEAAIDSHPWALLTLLPHAKSLSTADFSRTTALVRRAVQNGHDLALPGGGRLDLTDAPKPADFLWHQSAYIRDVRGVREWLRSLAELGGDLVREGARGAAFEWGCLGLCDGIWLREADKTVAQRDWGSVEDLLLEVRDAATQLNLPLLVACAERARMVVRADYREALESAVELVEEALTRASNDSTATFILAEAIGRQCVRAGRADGRAYLERAVSNDASSFSVQKSHAMLWLSRAVGATHRQEAARIAAHAVTFAATIGSMPAIEIAKAFGEAAIAQWLAGNLAVACQTFAEGAKHLFRCRSDLPTWRDVVVLFGHLGAFLCTIATTGRQPVTTDASDPFELPAPGLFLTFHTERHSLYSSEREFILLHILTRLADWLAEDEQAAEWASHGLVLARSENGSTSMEFFLETILIVEDAVARGGAPALRRACGSRRPADLVPFAVLCGTAGIATSSVIEGRGLHAPAQTMRRELDDADPGESERATWVAACRLLDALSGATSPTIALTEIAHDGIVNQFVRIAASLATSVQDDRRYPDALADQIAAVWELEKSESLFRTIRRRLISPLIVGFWTRAVERSPFQFRLPSDFKDELRDVSARPAEHRSRIVLRHAASALGLRAPDAVAAWLCRP